MSGTSFKIGDRYWVVVRDARGFYEAFTISRRCRKGDLVVIPDRFLSYEEAQELAEQFNKVSGVMEK